VWLITAGGAMFAAFPHWYATLFSGFYLPLLLMLVTLIVRGHPPHRRPDIARVVTPAVRSHGTRGCAVSDLLCLLLLRPRELRSKEEDPPLTAEVGGRPRAIPNDQALSPGIMPGIPGDSACRRPRLSAVSVRMLRWRSVASPWARCGDCSGRLTYEQPGGRPAPTARKVELLDLLHTDPRQAGHTALLKLWMRSCRESTREPAVISGWISGWDASSSLREGTGICR
jgi:hypothetical protein